MSVQRQYDNEVEVYRGFIIHYTPSDGYWWTQGAARDMVSIRRQIRRATILKGQVA